MSDYIKRPTTREVWAVIHASHRSELEVFESFSDPAGTFAGGPGEVGRMETAYGLRGTDYPLLWAKTTWSIQVDGTRRDERNEYWLCIAKRED